MVRFLILFIFTISISLADSVSGIAYCDGKPLRQKTIRLLEKYSGKYDKSVVTTDKGYYKFSYIPKGEYEIITKVPCYSSRPITITGGIFSFKQIKLNINGISYSEKKRIEIESKKDLNKQKINKALNHPLTKYILIFFTIILSGWFVKKQINKIDKEIEREKERKEEYLRRTAIAKETKRKNKIKEEKRKQEQKKKREEARKLKQEKELKAQQERQLKRIERRKELKEKAETPIEKQWAAEKFYDLDKDPYSLEGILKFYKEHGLYYLNNKKVIRLKTLGVTAEILERAIFKECWLGRGIVNNIKEKKKEVKWVDLEIDLVKRKILRSPTEKSWHLPPFKPLNPKPRKPKKSKSISKRTSPKVSETYISNVKTTLVGTGFLISKEGYIATAAHVIDGASLIVVRFPFLNLEHKAKVISIDENNDVALIKIPKTQLNSYLSADIPFFIRNQNKFDLGQDVYAYGYPMGETLGSKPSFTDGRISSFEGIKGDKTTYRVSNPIQPGNSGGPIVDNKGRLLGIIISSFDAFASLELSDALPQNVNFAVKTDYLIALTNSTSNSSFSSNIFKNDTTPTELSPTELTKKILPFVPQIRTNIPDVTDEMRFEREEPKGLLGNLADGLNKWLEEIE